MTIKEYIKSCLAEHKPPFIDTDLIDSDGDDTNLYTIFGETPYEIYSGYFQQNLTDYMKFNHGKKELIEDITEDDETYEEVIARVLNIYRTNEYKYRTLARSMRLEYNPIENNYRVEHNTTKFEKGEQENTFGQRKQTNTYGDVDVTNNYDKVKETSKRAKVESVDSYDEVTETDKRSPIEVESDIKQRIDSVKKAPMIVEDDIKQREEQSKKAPVKVTDDIKLRYEYEKKAPIKVEDNIAQVTVTDKRAEVQTTESSKKAPMIVQDAYDARHKNISTSKSLGVSSFDDASDYGSTGISVAQDGTMTMGTSGNTAYNPKEREINENIENDIAYTDTHTTTQDRSDDTNGDVKTTSVEQIGNTGDTSQTSSHIDTHTTSQDRTNDTDGDVKTYTAHADEHTTEQIRTNDTNGDVTTFTAHKDVHTTSQDRTVDTDGDVSTYGAHKDVVTTTQLGNDGDTHTTASYDVTHTVEQLGNTGDTKEVDEREDTVNTKKGNDTITNDEYTNTEAEREDNTTYDSEVRGNIGTLTNQQMIEMERKISNINLVKIVAEEIVAKCCMRVYEEG